MAYGTLKADKITYDNGGSDTEVNVSDLTSLTPLASPAFTGTPTAPTAAADTNTTQLATTAYVQTELGDYAPLASPTFTGTPTVPGYAPLASPTFTGTVTSASIAIDGQYTQVAEAVGALDIDLSTGNYFTKTINANSTFTFSSPPASGTVGSFTLELTHTSGTVGWPDANVSGTSTVKWPAATPPTLTAGKTHLFIFITDDGGTTYRGASLADYVN